MDCAKQHVWMQIEHLYTVNKHQLKKVSEFSIIFSAYVKILYQHQH